MCQQLTILAECSSWRYVGQCEHGTVHLRWDHLTIHLQFNDFLNLYQIIKREAEAKSASKGKMRLGIGSLIIELQADDYQPLIELMQRAQSQLEGGARSRLEFCPRRSLARSPTISIDGGCS
jgi:hypothetical protein